MMDLLIDDEQLQVTFERGAGERGAGGRTVFSFAGVGFGDGYVQKAEFGRSLTIGDGDRNDVYYLIDRHRSWFNDTDAAIRGFLAETSPAGEVFTLGNSMGGFGALLYGRQIPNCRAAIAFAPQFSVRKSIVPKEKRWRIFTSRISNWVVETCIPPTPPNTASSFIFFGSHDIRDWRHADLFRKALTGDDAIFFIHGCRHDVASYLARKEALAPLLDSIINEGARAEDVSAFLRARGLKHRLWRTGDRVTPGLIERAERRVRSLFR